METLSLFSVRYGLGSSFTWQGIRGGSSVLSAIALVLLLQIILTYVPFMNTLFETRPFGIDQLAQCAAGGILLLIMLEIDKGLSKVWRLTLRRTAEA